MFYAEQGTYYESCRCFLREDGSQSPFEDILSSGWFAIVTMTTVGYGEKTVVTPAGKAIASLCMVCGIIIISLPITIIGANFDEELKAMEIEKRNRVLLKLMARHGGAGSQQPGSTLELVEKVLDVHRRNLDSMLLQVDAQMNEQRAQMAAVVQSLRTQLSKHGVALDVEPSQHAAQQQLLSASAWRGSIRRETSFNSFASEPRRISRGQSASGSSSSFAKARSANGSFKRPQPQGAPCSTRGLSDNSIFARCSGGSRA